ncbi:MAG TPA: cellulose synthase operon protein YhjQ [Gallionella sp.]|jgi:cellulose synthase operon protein YhjQ|nr:cellulose biosynthesis protein BcsQ [Gallionella sp.]OGS66962.1 MAG: cellulose synthase operon protein YhjQ [Gallionellales bacterium GWA2_54_124]OGT20710.1 MAG: cellulose synthase operon protein YhjQ [Gallionellales bacterium RIFOXYD12_FULL_53_10]HCI51723.1 cellulose synthase operon protein YhjQ [Gallionella sp.]
MTVIAVISPKGGVGKTTVAVNLACKLAAGGHPVRLVDLDPQNALRLHLGADPADVNGLVHQTLQQSSWYYTEYDSAYGVSFVPYGKGSEFERITFEAHLSQTPEWLRDNLMELGRDPNSYTILDTPPGPSVYVQQALSIANLVLVVMIPDAGSYATLTAIEGLLDYYCANRTDFYGSYYVLNQFDADHPLNRDIKTVMQTVLGDRLAPFPIHRDESLSEALAYQQPAAEYAPHCQAVDDIAQLTGWLQNQVDQAVR